MNRLDDKLKDVIKENQQLRSSIDNNNAQALSVEQKKNIRRLKDKLFFTKEDMKMKNDELDMLRRQNYMSKLKG